MERKFILSCCSTVDLPYSYMEQRDIPVLFYTYVVDGQEYVDDMGRDPEALPRFYRFLQEGKLPQTSQINVATYLDFFEQQLQHGDLLHLSFTSGQSGSVHNAQAAGKLLQEKYPDKKIVVVDSLCSSSPNVLRRNPSSCRSFSPTCAMRALRSTRSPTGSCGTATRYTTSSSPPT